MYNHPFTVFIFLLSAVLFGAVVGIHLHGAIFTYLHPIGFVYFAFFHFFTAFFAVEHSLRNLKTTMRANHLIQYLSKFLPLEQEFLE